MDLTGKKFGRLIAIEKIVEKHIAKWKCICECGNETIVYQKSLKSGNTKSCGCLRREVGLGNYKHGQSGYNTTKEYIAWIGMKQRCYNHNTNRFKHYGDKGITVCEKWLNSFEAFLADVGLAPSVEHSIDRINNDGNYEPNNVRWATPIEQTNNRSV